MTEEKKEQLNDSEVNTENNTDTSVDNDSNTNNDNVDAEQLLNDLSQMIAETLKSQLSDEELKGIKGTSVSPVIIGHGEKKKTNKYASMYIYLALATLFNVILALTSSAISTDFVSILLFSILSELSFYLINKLIEKKWQFLYLFTFGLFAYLIKIIFYVGFYFALRSFLYLEVTNILGIIVIFVCSSICSKHLSKHIDFLMLSTYKKKR